jgi:hypothetical protein
MNGFFAGTVRELAINLKGGVMKETGIVVFLLFVLLQSSALACTVKPDVMSDAAYEETFTIIDDTAKWNNETNISFSCPEISINSKKADNATKLTVNIINTDKYGRMASQCAVLVDGILCENITINDDLNVDGCFETYMGITPAKIRSGVFTKLVLLVFTYDWGWCNGIADAKPKLVFDTDSIEPWFYFFPRAKSNSNKPNKFFALVLITGGIKPATYKACLVGYDNVCGVLEVL